MGCGVTDNLQAPLCQHELNMLELLFMIGMTYVVLSQTTCYGAHAYNAHWVMIVQVQKNAILYTHFGRNFVKKKAPNKI